MHWPFKLAEAPSPEEITREINGHVVEEIAEPKDAQVVQLQAGQQLDGCAKLRDDRKTACGSWIYSRCFTEKGDQMARRDNADPYESGLAPNWAWAWPVNRPILYNRASRDFEGKPWTLKHKLIEWDGKKWTGADVPDYPPTMKPEAGMNPFIMNLEGRQPVHARSYEGWAVPRTL